MLSPGPPGGTPPADSVTLQLGVTRVFCKLYGNGYRLAHWWLSENQTKKLSCVIEPEQWLQRSGGGLLKLVWHLPDSRKPFEMTHTQDHRQLGFCFHKLTLTAATS